MRADDFVVLTQNAWGGAALWSERRRHLARRIHEIQPSVVGLQEVHAESARGGPGPNQASEIAVLLGGYTAWFAPGRVASSGESEGVALLIRNDIEVLNHSVEALTLDRNDPFERESQRIVMRAAICVRDSQQKGAIIDVLVTHLSLSKRARLRTARELLDFAARERQKSGSVGAVMMGDLNESPHEEAISLIKSSDGWIDAWAHLHPDELGGTWPAGVPFRRIDYVFVQPDEHIGIVSCERTPFSGSDHLGVAAQLRVTGLSRTEVGRRLAPR